MATPLHPSDWSARVQTAYRQRRGSPLFARHHSRGVERRLILSPHDALASSAFNLASASLDSEVFNTLGL